MGSAIAKVIDAVIATGLAPAAKAVGFRKQARNFRRTTGDAILVTNAQASISNDADEGRFTVNLGVYFPAVGRLGDSPLRDHSQPPDYTCQIRKRIGELMPVHNDHWWRVRADSDVAALAAEVANAWRQHGLPWLEANANLDAAADRFASAQPFLAIQMCLAQGRKDRCIELLNRLMADQLVPEGHRNHVAQWATRHGLLA